MVVTAPSAEQRVNSPQSNSPSEFLTSHHVSVLCPHLQTDGQVDSAAEGRADGPRVKAEVFEEFGEGVRERHARPLLRHHHTGPNPGQIQTPSLDGGTDNRSDYHQL